MPLAVPASRFLLSDAVWGELQDSDVLTTNMPYMHATFAKAKYADAIPLEGKVIQVTVPPTNVERNGGIGLDDLEVYLDPAARTEALSGEEGEEGERQKEREWGPPGRDVMDVKLERSGAPFLSSLAVPLRLSLIVSNL
jgi:hypothetical protein